MAAISESHLEEGYTKMDISYVVQMENYCDQFLLDFGQLLKDQCGVDVTLTNNQQSIRVHKVVLIARSSYFRNYLKIAGECIIMFDTNFNVISSIVEFIYFGKTSFSNINAKEVVAAAKLFNIKGLAEFEFEDDDLLQPFPSPVIISAIEQNSNAMCDIGEPSFTENKLSSEQYLNLNESSGFKYITRIPIVLKNDKEEYDINASSKKRRGRPRKHPNPSLLKTAIKTQLARESEESTGSFHEYFKVTKSLEEHDNSLMLAVNCINDSTYNPNMSDLYFDYGGNQIETLELPMNDINSNEFPENILENDDYILFNMDDGTLINTTQNGEKSTNGETIIEINPNFVGNQIQDQSGANYVIIKENMENKFDIANIQDISSAETYTELPTIEDKENDKESDFVFSKSLLTDIMFDLESDRFN